MIAVIGGGLAYLLFIGFLVAMFIGFLELTKPINRKNGEDL